LEVSFEAQLNHSITSKKRSKGHEVVRNLWRDYFTEADAVIFVVDSAEPERLLIMHLCRSSLTF